MSGRDIIDLTERAQVRGSANASGDLTLRRGELERHVDQLERDLGQAVVVQEGQRRAEEQAERQLDLARRDLHARRAHLEQRMAEARAVADEFTKLKGDVVEIDAARAVVDAEIGRIRRELEHEADRYRALRRECRDSAIALGEIKASLRRVEEEVNVLLVKQEARHGAP